MISIKLKTKLDSEVIKKELQFKIEVLLVKFYKNY